MNDFPTVCHTSYFMIDTGKTVRFHSIGRMEDFYLTLDPCLAPFHLLRFHTWFNLQM